MRDTHEHLYCSLVDKHRIFTSPDFFLLLGTHFPIIMKIKVDEFNTVYICCLYSKESGQHVGNSSS